MLYDQKGPELPKICPIEVLKSSECFKKIIEVYKLLNVYQKFKKLSSTITEVETSDDRNVAILSFSWAPALKK